MQPNGEPLPVYVTTMPMPVTRKLLDLGRKRYDITCAHLPRPARRRGQHRRAPDVAAPAAVAAPLRRQAGRLLLRGHHQGLRHDGVVRRRARPCEERWAVVAYIRALQLSQLTPAGDAARRTRGSGSRRCPRGAGARATPAEHHEEKP